MKIVIVGGVAGGASAAARLRRLNESAEIIMCERGRDISYANCGLPYHIGNVITDRNALEIMSQSAFSRLLNVDVRTYTEVTHIDCGAKTVQLLDRQKNITLTESYDKLILSPGAQPIRPQIPGVDQPGIFTLRSLEDMDTVKAWLTRKSVTQAVVVGGGFIGLEMAENLMHLGLAVSVVEKAPHVMAGLDSEMAAFVHQELRSNHIRLYLNDGVTAFRSISGPEDTIEVMLESGRSVQAQLIMLSIGVRPEVTLAQAAGLKLGESGGIAVNSSLQTSDPNIYALGDATEIINSVTGATQLIPLANSANKQGRIAADNIMGKNRTYSGTPGTAICKVCSLAAGFTGLNERTLKKLGWPYGAVHLNPPSHAAYYPEASYLAIKMLYHKTTHRILGAQVIGTDGVDKRLDVFSTLIQLSHTVQDLAELELTYAPPYGSAKDPVNLAGMIALNQIEELNQVVEFEAIEQFQTNGVIIDVRSKTDYQHAHIEGAINIPLKEIRARLTEISREKPILVYCFQGKSAYFALRTLRNAGFAQVFNLNGGFDRYYIATQPQENTLAAEDMAAIEQPQTGTHTFEKLTTQLNSAQLGDIVEIVTTDPGFRQHIQTWCTKHGHTLVSLDREGARNQARIQKGGEAQPLPDKGPNAKTLYIPTDEFDRVLPALLIAREARALGQDVTLFFASKGINLICRDGSPHFNSSFFTLLCESRFTLTERIVSFFRKQKGRHGMQLVQKALKTTAVQTWPEVIRFLAQEGVRMVVCQATLDLFDLKPDRIISGVREGRVQDYFSAAETANTHLFV